MLVEYSFLSLFSTHHFGAPYGGRGGGPLLRAFVEGGREREKLRKTQVSAYVR